MANDGNVDLGDLNPAEETPFHLEGSLDPALPLPLFMLEGSGYAGASLQPFDLLMTLPAFSLAGATADGLTLPAFALAGRIEAGTYISGRLDLSAPVLSGSLEPALQLPAITLAATGNTGPVATAPLLVLPAPQVAASSGLDSAALLLAPFEASGDGVTGTLASASLSLPLWSVGSSGLQDTAADGQVTLALLQLDAFGGADALVEGAVTLSMPQLEAFAGTGQVSSAELTVPLFDIGASGFMEAIGSATLQIPAFEIAGQGASIGTGPVAVPRVTTTAIVLNTRLKGVVRYEGLAANSFATFAGVQLAATPDGIVALMGDTDLGAPIAASVTSGTSDLGMNGRKRIEAAYVGYRSGGDMEMTLITDEHHEYTYRLVARQIGDAIHSTRVKFGRGVDGRYWQWKLANTGGGAFDLASMQLNVIPLARSV